MSAIPSPEPTRSGPSSALLAAAGLLAFAAAILVGSLIGGATPADARIKGVDVASYQHPNGVAIDWNAVRAGGYSFAITKATEGTTYTNPWYARDFAASGAAGLYRSAYHYARPALPLDTALAQARYFVSVAGSLTGSSDLPAMLDLEETGGLAPADLAQWTRTWLAEVTRLTGKRPMIYTGYYFWRDSVGNPADMGSQYRLVIANYHCQGYDGTMFCDPRTDTYSPTLPAGWSTWTFWQYTSVERVPGIVGDVDVNWFCCDLSVLASLAGSGAGAGNPWGAFESTSREPDGLHVTGWAMDPDTTGAIDIHVYVDGTYAGRTSANGSRPDIAAGYPSWGANHGFDLTVPSPSPGAHQVCVYAINSGTGNINTWLGCRTSSGLPYGSLGSAVGTGFGTIDVSGWVIDPDTTNPVAVHFYVDGAYKAMTTTTVNRPDVAAAHPGATTVGYSMTLAGIGPGPHRVCAYAIEVGPEGVNPLIACRGAVVGGGNPFGGFSRITPVIAGARIEGWAMDPDTVTAIPLHVYVDGSYSGTYIADVARSDLASAYPQMGANHGINSLVPLTLGRHDVCVFGINIGAGDANSFFGCRSVTVVGGAPFGTIESAVTAYGYIGVEGIAVDPDTTGATQVHVYVNGRGVATTADIARPDVMGRYPIAGDNHGYRWIGPRVGTGSQTVCIWAINVAGAQSHTLLGCRTIA